MNDDRWIDTLREEFTPAPTSPERAAELRRSLRERVAQERPRPRFALPALATAAGAALLLWAAWPSAPVTPSAGSATSAEVDAFVDPDEYASELTDRAEYLPADYQGLALLLEDDTADR
jgi:hypothetical protein